MTCATCKFFYVTYKEYGDCRRFPPTPVSAQYRDADHKWWQVDSMHPNIINGHWCGEHQSKSTVNPDA